MKSQAILCSTILSTLLAGGAFAADPAPAAPPADPYQELGKINFESSYTAIFAIENEITKATPEQCKQIEAKLLALLQKAETPLFAKEFICKELRQLGSANSVPTLAGMLTDEKLSHMARYALQKMACPAAGSALREALEKSSGKLKIGLVGSLGERGDIKSVPAIAKLLQDSDPLLVDAALAALGNIGTGECADILVKSKVPESLAFRKNDACMICADKCLVTGNGSKAVAIYQSMLAKENKPGVRVGGLRGLIRAKNVGALPVVIETLSDPCEPLQKAAARSLVAFEGSKATKALSDRLATASPEVQYSLLAALAERGDRTGLPAVTKLVASENEPVRIAALKALSMLGDASSVELLLKNGIESGDAAKVAQESLRVLKADGVDKALMQQMQAGDKKLRLLAIQMLGERRSVAALKTLEKATADTDADLNRESYKALGLAVDEDNLSLLVKLLTQSNGKGEAEEALASASRRMFDMKKCESTILAALTGASGESRCALIRVAGRLGGDKSLEAVRAALKESNEKVQDAAVRSLADSEDARALPDLLEIAKSSSNKTQSVIALRGYIHIAGMGGKHSENDQIKLLKEALAAVPAAEQKKMVIGALGNIQNAGVFKVLEPLLADEVLKADAANAYLRIVASMKDRHHGEAVNGLKKFLTVCKEGPSHDKAVAELAALDGKK